MNPDRTNIYIGKKARLSNIYKFEKLDSIIEPFAQELFENPETFPLTIMYMENLESLGYCYKFLDCFLGNKQYIGKVGVPENRIFAQYHKDYTPNMKLFIIKELSRVKPTVRLVLATVALGMGLNAPCIERIVHCRPPTTLEGYMQEIGRAGRQGQKAEAVLYYNNSDISRSRKGMSEAMIYFCRNENSCLRKQLLQHFGFDEAVLLVTLLTAVPTVEM